MSHLCSSNICNHTGFTSHHLSNDASIFSIVGRTKALNLLKPKEAGPLKVCKFVIQEVLHGFTCHAIGCHSDHMIWTSSHLPLMVNSDRELLVMHGHSAERPEVSAFPGQDSNAGYTLKPTAVLSHT